MSKLAEQVNFFLNDHESAASAWCIVNSFFTGILTSSAQVDEAYERSEGENDEMRGELLKQLNQTQLSDLAAYCIQVSLEKLADYE